MTDLRWSNFGGDPSPGSPAQLSSLSRQLEEKADLIKVARVEIGDIVRSDARAIWRGGAADAFAAQVEDLPSDLWRLERAARRGAHALSKWAEKMASYQSDAEYLLSQRLAADAQAFEAAHSLQAAQASADWLILSEGLVGADAWQAHETHVSPHRHVVENAHAWVRNLDDSIDDHRAAFAAAGEQIADLLDAAAELDIHGDSWWERLNGWLQEDFLDVLRRLSEGLKWVGLIIGAIAIAAVLGLVSIPGFIIAGLLFTVGALAFAVNTMRYVLEDDEVSLGGLAGELALLGLPEAAEHVGKLRYIREWTGTIHVLDFVKQLDKAHAESTFAIGFEIGEWVAEVFSTGESSPSSALLDSTSAVLTDKLEIDLQAELLLQSSTPLGPVAAERLERLETARSILAGHAVGSRDILHLSVEQGELIEVLGNLESATNVIVHIPGTGATVADYSTGIHPNAASLWESLDSETQETTALISALEYPAPPAGSVTLPFSSSARVGAAKLDSLVAQVDASFAPGRIDVVTDSYGSQIIAELAPMNPRIDQVVVVDGGSAIGSSTFPVSQVGNTDLSGVTFGLNNFVSSAPVRWTPNDVIAIRDSLMDGLVEPELLP